MISLAGVVIICEVPYLSITQGHGDKC